MAELVDAADLKSVDRKVVGVKSPRALLSMKMQRSAEACKYKGFNPNESWQVVGTKFAVISTKCNIGRILAFQMTAK